MPAYLIRRDADHHVQELEASAITDAAQRASHDSATLAWPTTPEAATAELVELARDLVDAGVTVQWLPEGLVLPHLGSNCDDTADIRITTTRRAPHALYVITASPRSPTPPAPSPTSIHSSTPPPAAATNA